MPYTKKKTSRNRGTPNCPRSQNNKNKASAPKISKYFTKPPESSDSPYTNCLTEVKTEINDSTSELDDFKTPKAINKVSKIVQLKPPKSTKKKRGKPRQVPLRKFVEDNFKYVDVNPDHLQTALALSESSYEAEHPAEASTQEKLDSFKKAFERFGFGYSKNRIAPQNTKEPPELIEKKSRKKSRYRYITPILKLRTAEERESLIASKVSLIMAQNNRFKSDDGFNCEQELFSAALRKYQVAAMVFKLNNLGLEELSVGKFYAKGLNLGDCRSSCGNLLRDWGKIPGREKSPSRGKSRLSDRGISPDLFGSDDEDHVIDLELSNRQLITNHLNENSSCDSPIHEISRSEENPNLSQQNIKISDDEELEQVGGAVSSVNFSITDFLIINEKLSCDSPKIDLSRSEENPNLSQQSILISDDEALEQVGGAVSSVNFNVSNYITDMLNEKSACDSPKVEISRSEENPNLSQHNIEISDDEVLEQVGGAVSSVNFNITDYITDMLNEKSGWDSPKIDSSNLSQQSSQDSILISDDELNYSSVNCTSPVKRKVSCDLSDLDDVIEENHALASLDDSFVCQEQSGYDEPEIPHQIAEMATPAEKLANGFLIKTKNVTPMANYDDMDTPKIAKELDKYGLKPLKRQRGAKLLRYIYDSTHPLVEDGSDVDDGKVVKRSRQSLNFNGVDVVGDIEDDLVFERTQSKRIPSCRIPLHVVWHNFVVDNPKIRENILLYEPLQLEVLHSMLKEQGFKFNIQDLLTFLDKKCITIRTCQGQRYGKKKQCP